MRGYLRGVVYFNARLENICEEKLSWLGGITQLWELEDFIGYVIISVVVTCSFRV
jgi:hypothetical protein